MPAISQPNNIDILRGNLEDYQQLLGGGQEAKLKEVAQQIAHTLPNLTNAQIATLAPQDLKAIEALAGKSFFEITQTNANANVLMDFLTRVDQPTPDGASSLLDAKEAAIDGQREHKEKQALAQSAASPAEFLLTLSSDPKSLETSMGDFIKRIPDANIRHGMQQEFKQLKDNLMNARFEAEGFEAPMMKQAMAFLVGAPNKLKPRQKAALEQALKDTPSDSAQRELLQNAAAAFNPESLQTISALPPAQQELLRTHFTATRDAVKNVSNNPAGLGVALEDPLDDGDQDTMDDKSIDKLPESLRNPVKEYRNAKHDYDRLARRIDDEVMGLLHSGIPIESLILMVMLRLGEKAEGKLKYKIEELQLSQQLEKNQLNPGDFGLKVKSESVLMQELQAAMQQHSQLIQSLSEVMRQLQYLVMTPIRNML
ncbi:MAG: hypothetical protein QGI45_11315 [Myxococcota bacterium]|nr:hypothetical protein [Myxococcota bacterium]